MRIEETLTAGPVTSSPVRPTSVAIVGTGGIANAHAEALSAQPGLAITAAIDIDPDRAKEFAQKWKIGTTAASIAHAVDQTAPDVVVICTPPSSHVPLALEALGHGLHVVIEKPPAMSLAQMKQLQAAEEGSSGTVSCIFQHRFSSAVQRLRELQESGQLGRPLVGVCNTLWFRNQAYFDVPWRGLWDVEGGGPTMGHGIHQFDLLLHLWGPWSQVSAFAAKLARKTDTEDISAGVVRFESGAIATVINSVISPRETSSIRLDFEYATVELEHLYGYDDGNWVLTPAPGHEYLTELWSSGANSPSGHASQYAVIAKSLREGSEPPVSLRDAYQTVELAAAIYASSITGKPIASGDIGPESPFFGRMDGHLDPWKQEVSFA
ncbi:Predicted dehydrogenase [Arthrobacter alpinus]|uniref:Predicted dehydrogenase n=1 Tax=Arthrobacter alpinus TaxID=656366 RepID=A0A1H5MEJ7_9MICC|nr:Gfo/Idh/MocA family oxidoreductase [Arthrobacter alpinus]SEE87725.1 Predicted dehydrogenase [Arthrobacter alpinus]